MLWNVIRLCQLRVGTCMYGHLLWCTSPSIYSGNIGAGFRNLCSGNMQLYLKYFKIARFVIPSIILDHKYYISTLPYSLWYTMRSHVTIFSVHKSDTRWNTYLNLYIMRTTFSRIQLTIYALAMYRNNRKVIFIYTYIFFMKIHHG